MKQQNIKTKINTNNTFLEQKEKVKIIDVANLMPYGSETAIFNGFENGANVSFFIVYFSPGQGPKMHRHPYEETFIILEGAIDAVVDGRNVTVPAGNIMVVPPNTWHSFTNNTETQVLTVNIHPTGEMKTEWYCE